MHVGNSVPSNKRKAPPALISGISPNLLVRSASSCQRLQSFRTSLILTEHENTILSGAHSTLPDSQRIRARAGSDEMDRGRRRARSSRLFSINRNQDAARLSANRRRLIALDEQVRSAQNRFMKMLALFTCAALMGVSATLHLKAETETADGENQARALKGKPELRSDPPKQS